MTIKMGLSRQVIYLWSVVIMIYMISIVQTVQIDVPGAGGGKWMTKSIGTCSIPPEQQKKVKWMSEQGDGGMQRRCEEHDTAEPAPHLRNRQHPNRMKRVFTFSAKTRIWQHQQDGKSAAARKIRPDSWWQKR